MKIQSEKTEFLFRHLGIKTYFLYFTTKFQQNQYIYKNLKFFYAYFFIFFEILLFFRQKSGWTLDFSAIFVVFSLIFS